MPCAFKCARSCAKCSWFRVSTVQSTLTVETSEPANARSCTICLMLAPVAAICLLKTASPPGRSLITAVNRHNRPSATRPRSITRPRIFGSILPPHKRRTTRLPASSDCRVAWVRSPASEPEKRGHDDDLAKQEEAVKAFRPLRDHVYLTATTMRVRDGCAASTRARISSFMRFSNCSPASLETSKRFPYHGKTCRLWIG